jgi:uncharacterized membrane protein YphA (DoxX/SURF4 family)
MELTLWILTLLIAAVFTFSGVLKSSLSRDRLLATGQTGIAPFPMPLIRLVAVSELLAVVGLVAPQLSGTAEVLTPVAAMGLMVVMWGAAISHASLREPRQVAANIGLLVLCGVVAAGRLAQLG